MAPSKKKHASSQPCVIPGGFTVLSLQFSSDSVAQHELYVKEHKVRAEKSSHRPLDRTLFSVELRDHPGSSQDSGPKLSRFFKPVAKQGFRVGYVVFENSSSLRAAKSHPRDVSLVVCTEQRPVKTGVQKWIQQYTESFINPDILQKIVDSFMEGYDKRKEEEVERQREAAEQQKEDEEGWVKVTRGAKGTKGRPHNIADLRKKFEEDKQRIALLRAQRKFKPY
ncbi:hypothetical protein FQN60_003525 [Etheostoma spectabile]|uniref:Ribosomal RNA-processing protein 7 C-terminal domain-containing protein n=1 Tax=Etheostoma spectabile TaxID=54343 RepID=A0A5J5CZS2_9PERO|nr:hypothetical protein FQN60_003525 [Etheostoma spectabile]